MPQNTAHVRPAADLFGLPQVHLPAATSAYAIAVVGVEADLGDGAVELCFSKDFSLQAIVFGKLCKTNKCQTNKPGRKLGGHQGVGMFWGQCEANCSAV